MTFSVIARQFPVCDVRVSLGGSVRYYQSLASSRHGPMDLPHSVFLRLSCLFHFFLHRYSFTVHRYLFTIHRYLRMIHRYLFAGTYMFGLPKQCSMQHTFGAPISWALPNAKPSALYEMIYRINEFIKSVSTLFYHLRATSLCFGSVTSD